MSNAAPRKTLSSLWLIVALTTAPVVASYLAYYFWRPAHTVNYGDLIGPGRLPDPALTQLDGTPFRFSQLKGKWALVSLDSGRCAVHCDEKLLYMRQLRLTQGKDQDRIERVWLVVDDAVPPAGLVARYPGTWVVRSADAGLLRLFPGKGLATDHIYLVDPLGNVMLRFPRDPEPRLMIKDLSRLLKASQIG
jgi:cytochrome oxidase Cu insertion factor (SCO1/SenC/PrrC family)